jgi:transcriptional antiterminator
MKVSDIKSPEPRQPRRTEMQCEHDRAILARIALKNPGASSVELADLFYLATEHKLAPRTIRDDLKKIREKWLEEMIGDFNLLKSAELAKVDVLEQEAWDAWNQSKSDFVKEVVERARKRPAKQPDAGNIITRIVSELADQNAYVNEEIVEAIIHDAIKQTVKESIDTGEDSDTFISKIVNTTESRIGDVRYLRAIHEVQQERRKILGVYAPELHKLDIRKFEIKGYAGTWSPDVWKDGNVVDGEIVEPPRLEERS